MTRREQRAASCIPPFAMRIFVTGATGFLGGHLAAKLIARGDEVTCLVRDPRKADRLSRLGATIAPGDINARESMRTAMKGVDAVFHVAAWYQEGDVEAGAKYQELTNFPGPMV